jgi:hypothetical protein
VELYLHLHIYLQGVALNEADDQRYPYPKQTYSHANVTAR